ncbi:MAG: 30S ribosome-binding factor RbfA [Gammaproteobacteria bacterium]|nr:30S ribosome-binding factor RbfA [Gammaproteobacteria bacterium]HOO92641.1 30S ribosome-binding factor RbfA [Opitutales bacterium]
MAREFKRTDRVGAQMHRELAVLLREELDDPRLGMITIQEVRVVRDFSHATIYFTVMAGDAGRAETTRILNDAAPFFRHELGRRMKLRTLPELRFVHDGSVEQGEKLFSLIELAVKSDSDKHKE